MTTNDSVGSKGTGAPVRQLPEGFPEIVSDEEATRIIEVVFGVGEVAEMVKRLKTLTNRQLACLLVDHVWAYLPTGRPQAKLLDEVIDRLQGPEPWTDEEEFASGTPASLERRRPAIVCLCVSTAAECIDQLGANVWKVVSLDHDLNGETHVDSNRSDCGMEVVRWVVRNRPFVGRFIIHSWNEKASRRMVEALRQKGYPAVFEPFGEGMWKAPR